MSGTPATGPCSVASTSGFRPDYRDGAALGKGCSRLSRAKAWARGGDGAIRELPQSGWKQASHGGVALGNPGGTHGREERQNVERFVRGRTEGHLLRGKENSGRASKDGESRAIRRACFRLRAAPRRDRATAGAAGAGVPGDRPAAKRQEVPRDRRDH